MFDITQGVAIAVLIRKPGAAGERDGVVHHADLWGVRKEKEVVLDASSIGSITWQDLPLNPPFYLLVPQEQAVREEYESGWSVKDIFPVNSMGIVTARDALTIRWTADSVWQTVNDFAKTDSEMARVKYGLGADARDWKVSFAQQDLLRNEGLNENKVLPIAYRPFDMRFTYYTGVSRGFQCMPRNEVMQHMANQDNLALCITRQVNGTFAHIFCSRLITEFCVISTQTREGAYVLPLYVYPTKKKTLFDTHDGKRRPNLSPAFLDALRATLSTTDAKPTETNENDPANAPTPEAIFHYLYALLHAPTYRTRYAEFLKRDFPRVPLPPSRAVFNQAAHIGARLVALHLLEDPALNPHGIGFPVAGDHLVQKMRVGDRYSVETGRVHLNATEYFDNVPQAAWEFRVGGYQPAAKWLDDRAGRALTEDDIRHYRRMIAALRETGTLLPEADGVFAAVLAGS